MSDLDYAGKRVVVTGSSSGIGRATAALLLNLGAQVDGLDLRAGDLPLAGFHVADLRDAAAIDRAAAAIGGRIDALFNCAGIAPGPAPLDVARVNFAGTRHLTERLLPQLPAGGAIVNVASNGGAGWPGRLSELRALVATEGFDAAVDWFASRIADGGAAYSLSKEAVIVWTLDLAATLIRRGIRVNCTCPGAVSTPMLDEIERTTPSALIDAMAQPIGRRSSPEEQAWPLAFLGSDAASYINGAIMPVDGGFIAARTLAEDQPVLGRR